MDPALARSFYRILLREFRLLESSRDLLRLWKSNRLPKWGDLRVALPNRKFPTATANIEEFLVTSRIPVIEIQKHIEKGSTMANGEQLKIAARQIFRLPVTGLLGKKKELGGSEINRLLIESSLASLRIVRDHHNRVQEQCVSSQTTQDAIHVEVHSQHLPSTERSQNEHFTYIIRVENVSTDKTFQLMARHWKIYDVHEGTDQMDVTNVRGLKAVGASPILGPGEAFEYASGVSLSSSCQPCELDGKKRLCGLMDGSFQMLQLSPSPADFKQVEVATEQGVVQVHYTLDASIHALNFVRDA